MISSMKQLEEFAQSRWAYENITWSVVEKWAYVTGYFNALYIFEGNQEYAEICNFLSVLAHYRQMMARDDENAKKYFHEQAATARTMSRDPF